MESKQMDQNPGSEPATLWDGLARACTMAGRRIRRGWLLTLIVLLAIVLCVSVFRWHRDAGSIESPTNKRLPTFREYCHDSLLESIVGEEAQLPHTPHSHPFKLVQVHGLFRHGDRSPSIRTAYRGADVMYQCGMVDNDSKWLKLQQFRIKPNPKSTVPPKHTDTKLFRGFSSLRCTNFQLTLKGFQQLYALGEYMRAKYLNIFTKGDSVLTASDIFIQSTDYTRTIQSAASFSLGFTPDFISRSDVSVHVTPGTNLHAPPPHRETMYRRCKNFWKLYSEEVQRSEYMLKETRYKPFFDRIGFLLQISAGGNFDCEDIFDSVWGLICHKLPLPCRDGICLNESTVAQGAKYVNELFPEKHQFSNTILAIQPFLIHSIINEIDISMQYHHATADNPAEKKPFKFLFNFAHDSTLTFLLGSLGLRVDYWLPYASRVVIEVWEREQHDGDSKDHSPYFVRILLNGESLTKRITRLFPAQVIEMDGELLLYDAWRETMVKGPYREKSDFNKRCYQGSL